MMDGEDNYTENRHIWLDGLSNEDILKQIEEERCKMRDIYFANETHRTKFQELREKVKMGSDYLPLYYVLVYLDGNKVVNKYIRDDKSINFELLQQDRSPLSGSEAILLDLGKNLYSGSPVALGTGLRSWDIEQYSVAMEAMKLSRFGM